MLTDYPGRALFFFALPMILGNLFQQFYTTVDSIIVGQFVGEDALAAVGASYSLTTVFIMIAIGGGIGASVITSVFGRRLLSENANLRIYGVNQLFSAQYSVKYNRTAGKSGNFNCAAYAL